MEKILFFYCRNKEDIGFEEILIKKETEKQYSFEGKNGSSRSKILKSQLYTNVSRGAGIELFGFDKNKMCELACNIQGSVIDETAKRLELQTDVNEALLEFVGR